MTATGPLTKEICQEQGWLCHQENPNWRRYGKGAGHLRNTAMLEYDPDIVFAFHDHLFTESRGTMNCVKQALDRGLTVVLWHSDGSSEEVTEA